MNLFKEMLKIDCDYIFIEHNNLIYCILNNTDKNIKIIKYYVKENKFYRLKIIRLI